MSFIKKHKQKVIPLLLWLVIVGGFWIFAQQSDLSAIEMLQKVVDFLQDNPLGPVIFLVMFLIRPLLLFSNSVLMLLAGFLYGPILGFVLGLSGSTISAMVAFWIGWFFGKGLLPEGEQQSKVEKYAAALQRNGFEAVLIMRLVLLNYDFVSYTAGILHVNWQAFLWATILGSLAGTVAYVLAGASVEGDFTGQLPELDPLLIGVAAVAFVASLALAWFVRRRQQKTAGLSG
jgi:uncharacterized membrane protein YdjX (TVP38/TMEM64 family)